MRLRSYIIDMFVRSISLELVRLRSEITSNNVTRTCILPVMVHLVTSYSYGCMWVICYFFFIFFFVIAISCDLDMYLLIH